jgi:glycosyltransferase involved in cell wall biosynthesis
MHIAIDALLLKNQNTGTGFYTERLTHALSRLETNHRFTVFTDAAFSNHAAFESPSTQTMPVHLSGTLSRVMWEQLALPKKLTAVKADLVFCPFFIQPLRAKPPSVLVIHDALIKTYPHLIHPVRRFYLDTFIDASVKRAAHIITVSAFAKADILMHYRIDPSRVSVVPAAPDDLFSMPVDDATRQAVLKKYAIPFERFFLSVGSWHKYKNYPELITAFARAAKKNPALRLVMAGGDGNDTDTILNVIHSEDLQEKIFRAHYVAAADLPALYASAESLVMTSLYESFGMPIVEAMRCGLPVIAANRAAMPETLGNAGHLYTTQDELAEHLLSLWENTAHRIALRDKGFQRAATFSWQRSAELTVQIFENLTRVPV